MKPSSLLDAMAMHALHGAAWVALRVQSPRGARRTITKLGARLRPFANLDEARAAGGMLSRRGTCLSRSLVIASRLPGSSVVIGVDVHRSSRILAHAWVELGSDVVCPIEPAMKGQAIASF